MHEIGHSLGLDHSEAADSIMRPIADKYIADPRLTSDDIAAIQRLYGAKSGNCYKSSACIQLQNSSQQNNAYKSNTML